MNFHFFVNFHDFDGSDGTNAAYIDCDQKTINATQILLTYQQILTI